MPHPERRSSAARATSLQQMPDSQYAATLTAHDPKTCPTTPRRAPTTQWPKSHRGAQPGVSPRGRGSRMRSGPMQDVGAPGVQLRTLRPVLFGIGRHHNPSTSSSRGTRVHHSRSPTGARPPVLRPPANRPTRRRPGSGPGAVPLHSAQQPGPRPRSPGKACGGLAGPSWRWPATEPQRRAMLGDPREPGHIGDSEEAPKDRTGDSGMVGT